MGVYNFINNVSKYLLQLTGNSVILVCRKPELEKIQFYYYQEA